MPNLLYKIKTLLKQKALKYQCFIVQSYGESQRRFINLYTSIVSETETLTEPNEAFNIYSSVKSTNKLRGDIAEVGVYKGGTAKLICKVSADSPYRKKIYLFDTFEGLPKTKKQIDSRFSEGDYPSSYDDVKRYLSKYKNAYLIKGLFPSSANRIKNKKFSLVHLDVDIYQSTIDSLNFFYPRMVKSGLIISHDYSTANGVKKAFDEFFAKKPDLLFELQGSQCLVIRA